MSKFHFGLRLQIIELIEENDDIIIRERKGYSNYKEKISTVKEQLKNANDQQDKIKSEFEIFKKVSVEEWNELVDEKITLNISQKNSDRLQEQKSITWSLEEQTKLRLVELEKERSDYRKLCEKMDYKISLNKEIREWRKLCYEQSDKIQHYMSLELGSGSNHYPQSELNTTQRGHNHRQRGRRNPRIIGSAYRRGTIIPR